MRKLDPIRDGDVLIIPFTVDDGPTVRDTSTVAVEVYVLDEDSNLITIRPGVLVSPKSSGQFDVFLRGMEADFDGLGGRLFLKPHFYYATAPDGVTPATNLLVNPSFDAASGTNPARLPTSWSLIGARTAIWDNYSSDSAPATIFGNFQLVRHTTVSPLDPDYIQQGPAVTLAVGDPLSAGVWHRMGQSGSPPTQAKNDNHGIFFRPGSEANTVLQFEVVERDWYFVRGTTIASVAASSAVFGIDARGTTGSNRYDEAFFFKGRWLEFFADPIELKVKPWKRSRATNQISGIGSFEEDSNSDGLADGFGKVGTGGTFTIDKDPANVAHGAASQKIVLTDQTGVFLRIIHRGRFKAGDTWRASVKVKTNGALGSGSGTGGYFLQLASQYFDTSPRITSAVNLGTNLNSFTDHQASLAITNTDRSELVIEIALNGKTGTLWLDDVRLERTVAGP